MPSVRRVALAVAVIALAACTPNDVAGGSAHQVRYQVTADAPGVEVPTADMTFLDEGGDIAQQRGQTLPWTYALTGAAGQFLSVSAQDDTGEPVAITCQITVDGATVKQSTSVGAYAICEASGTL